jgi:NUMOD1 domain
MGAPKRMNHFFLGTLPDEQAGFVRELRRKDAQLRAMTPFKVWKWMLTQFLRMRAEEPTEAAIAAEAKGLLPGAVIVSDRLFDSVADAARAFGVKHTTINFRMGNGETVEQAILALAARGYKIGGAFYPSLKAAARAQGVSSPTLVLRMRKGQDPETAIRELKALAEPRLFVNGKGYPSKQAAVTEYGLNISTVNNRLWAFGETVEEAINVLAQREPIIVQGRSFTSVAEVARAFGVERVSINQRVLRRGETVEQAVRYLQALPIKMPIVVNGKNYPSVAHVARAYGIERKTLANRAKQQGETIEQAVRHFSEATAAHHRSADPCAADRDRTRQEFRY